MAEIYRIKVIKIRPGIIKADITIEWMGSINFMFTHVNSAFGYSEFLLRIFYIKDSMIDYKFEDIVSMI